MQRLTQPARCLRAAACLAAIVTVGLSACSSGGGPEETGFTSFDGPGITTGPATTGPLLEPELAEDLVWYRCRRVFECATFEVPTVYRGAYEYSPPGFAADFLAQNLPAPGDAARAPA